MFKLMVKKTNHILTYIFFLISTYDSLLWKVKLLICFTFMESIVAKLATSKISPLVCVA